jgi:hypothetical protein
MNSLIGHVALLPQRTWTDAWTCRCLITADLPKTELAPHACLLLT